MAALRRLVPAAALVGASLLGAAPAQGDAVADWRPFTLEASLRCGMPIQWSERVMRAESGGHALLKGRPVVSAAGAMGLMQLMPGTWAAMREILELGRDPFDPHDNILAGTCYLRQLYDRFGYPGLFAAYNAGPARYAAYLSGRGSLPGETRLYLASVAGIPRVPEAAGHRRPFLFAAIGNHTHGLSTRVVVAGSTHPEGLFAIFRAP